jgi:antitoxin (DNA-binding transcriptional repressor) of toxin-antitoxin stability system
MPETIKMLDATTSISRLVKALQPGAKTEFIIARNGRAAARQVPLAARGRVGPGWTP